MENPSVRQSADKQGSLKKEGGQRRSKNNKRPKKKQQPVFREKGGGCWGKKTAGETAPQMKNLKNGRGGRAWSEHAGDFGKGWGKTGKEGARKGEKEAKVIPEKGSSGHEVRGRGVANLAKKRKKGEINKKKQVGRKERCSGKKKRKQDGSSMLGPREDLAGMKTPVADASVAARNNLKKHKKGKKKETRGGGGLCRRGDAAIAIGAPREHTKMQRSLERVRERAKGKVMGDLRTKKISPGGKGKKNSTDPDLGGKTP